MNNRRLYTVQACIDLVGRPQDEISVAIINEAYAVEEGDKYWVLNNLNSVANNFKGGIDIVNLLALPLDKVEELDYVNKDGITIESSHVGNRVVEIIP